MQEQTIDLITTDEQPSIFWQDEILQVMYWMRGEGFGGNLPFDIHFRFCGFRQTHFQTRSRRFDKRIRANLLRGGGVPDAGV